MHPKEAYFASLILDILFFEVICLAQVRDL